MVHGLSVLREELPTYIADVKSKHSENSKAFAFSSFIQKVFGIESEDLDLEVPIKTTVLKVRGRVDAVFGNLIIEFKKDLRNSIDVAEDELVKYFQAYHENRPNVRFLGIANDGILFRVYQPLVQDDVVTKIELIDTIDIGKTSAEDVFLWFDSYLFTSDKIIPNSKDLKKRFGLESPTFAVITRQLRDLFTKVQRIDSVRVKYDNWSRFLEIIYGDRISELDLFFKHTYLSAFAN